MTLKNIELLPEDFDAAANLLAEAFYNNPSHTYIFPDSSSRLKFLQYGLKANLQLNLNSATSISKSFALVEDNQPAEKRDIKAMGFWNYPQASSPNFIDKARSGWLFMPLMFGRNYRRLTETIEQMEKIKKQVLHEKQAWYLNNMAVAQELRGKGIGSKLLRQQLESVVVPSKFPAILMTQKETNVRFYQKLGFEIAKRSTIGKGNNRFINWCLVFSK